MENKYATNVALALFKVQPLQVAKNGKPEYQIGAAGLKP